MPVNTYELVKAISVVMDNANIKVCVKKSAKGAIVCGAICFAGGLLLGPAGLAVGGAVGGLTAYKMNQGSFVPVGQILMNELTEDQTEQLVRHVNAAVADVGVSDLALLIPLLATQVDVQAKVLQVVSSFLINEMRMSIVD